MNQGLNNWSQMSLLEQLGNIGSEVGRARISQGKDENRFQGAVKRALELFQRTISDSRWHNQRQELQMAHDCFVDAIDGAKQYQTTLADLDEYFMYFAVAAMRQYDN